MSKATKTGFSKGDQLMINGEPALCLDGMRRKGGQLLIARYSTWTAELADLTNITKA